VDRLTETRLLVKIASLYYEQDLNQKDIASRLSLSQSFVSRAIKHCRSTGIVRFSIVHPTGTYVALENELQAKYGIDQMIVVHVDEDASDYSIKRAMGSAAASFLQSTLGGQELVGLSSWSSSISEMVEQMHPKSARAGEVIQILGGVGHYENLQANILTNELASTLQCSARLLPTKSISRASSKKNSQLEIEELADVVKRFPEVEIAIVGIGTNEPSELVRKAGIFTDEETETELKSLGAVGDLCLHYYNESGDPILDEGSDPVTSMMLSQLRDCPTVVALAGGLHKVEAIAGALSGGYLNVLITDCMTAAALANR
jgi:DNA-binding transcriptional regulator LsrR (DeoR family)